MLYRLAIFDFDGTLSDSLPWFRGVLDDIADRFEFRRVDAEEREALRHCGPREVLRRLGVPMWKVPAIAAHMRELKGRADIPLFDGARELIAGLAAEGVGLAMVSSDAETGIRRSLGPQAAGCFGHYDCSASLFGKAVKIRKAVKRFGCAPHQAIYIGDEVRDSEAAAKAGVAFGAVTWGYATMTALQACVPSELFMALPDISRISASAP
jgi:phosphoglycolate phosphatase